MNKEITNINNWRQEETRISDLYYWIYKLDIDFDFPYQETSIELIADHDANGDDITQFDFNFIRNIIDNIDFYFEKAIVGIKEEIKKDSGSFGLSENKISFYEKVEIKNFPVNQPNIIFYRNDEWMIRFAEADFPTVEHGLGIGITFRKDEITDISILDSDETIDEDM